MRKKVIIFDLDGTLIDSVSDLAASVNFMLRSLNLSEVEEKRVREWVGNGASMLVKRALGEKNIELFDRAISIFLNYYENNLTSYTSLYPGVKEVLQNLQDFKLSIVTNKPYRFIKPILEKLDIESYFDYYLGGDSLKEKKPHPMPLLKVCEEFGASADEALMVGDSKNDILAAKNAGMECVGVCYGYNYGENIENYSPDFIINDIKDLNKILRREA